MGRRAGREEEEDSSGLEHPVRIVLELGVGETGGGWGRGAGALQEGAMALFPAEVAVVSVSLRASRAAVGTRPPSQAGLCGGLRTWQ